MGILDILARLGILRVGGKAAVYRSGTERPTEFMMDGVYDAERDLVSGKSAPPPLAGKSGHCAKCGAALPDGARFCTACGQPVAP